MLSARMQRWLLPVLWPVLAVSLRLAPPASRAPAPAMLSVPGSSLRSTFEAALVLQRAGDADAALERYELFLQAARSLGTQVPPESFAEVLVNMGTIHAKRGDVSRAKQLFSEALSEEEEEEVPRAPCAVVRSASPVLELFEMMRSPRHVIGATFWNPKSHPGPSKTPR